MTTAATPTLSAAGFLFDNGEDSAGQLAAALKESGVLGSVISGLGKLSKAGMEAVGDQIASIGADLLGLGLDTLIVEGWRKFEDLQAAAQRTRAAGGSEVLDLASHSITSTHEPKIELRLDDIPVAALQFELSLSFVLKAVVATVRDGRLVSLHSGICDVDGSLAVQDKPLASRSGHFELPLLMRLGAGVPLLVDDVLIPVEITEPIDAEVDVDAKAGAATVVGSAEAPAPEVTEDGARAHLSAEEH